MPLPQPAPSSLAAATDNALDQLEVRICDFGWSAEVLVEQALKTTCGTPNYWPPEIFEGLPQSYGSDIWSLGNLVYELLVGHAPFWGSQEEIRQKEGAEM
ncbi:unnamed protein product [Prorocentrum cordatum]|uniref:Protein kinase domain-containing protein n=1 Tax=Prorocentrum cordatum TaxID=2364126 RepID=A0ABN9P6F6_9DINO|nr:unnamed protein product [Polarella glacialis]